MCDIYTVYALVVESDTEKFVYVGNTVNLPRRLKEIQKCRGKSNSTLLVNKAKELGKEFKVVELEKSKDRKYVNVLEGAWTWKASEEGYILLGSNWHQNKDSSKELSVYKVWPI